MSQSGHSRERDESAGDESRQAEGLPRPEIDPALLRALEEDATEGGAVDEGPVPWDLAAEVLENVPDEPDGAEVAGTENRPGERQARPAEETALDHPPAGDAADEHPAAVPVADVAEDIQTPATADAVSGESDPAAGASAGAPDVATEGATEEDAAAEPEGSEEDLAELREIPLKTRLEAILFASTEPLSLIRLRNLTAARDPVELRRTLDGLSDVYRETGSALILTEVGGGFVLRTRPELSVAVARLGRRRDQERLSNAALETLAIVAYRQPVLRADVEKIRGVASGEVLRSLTEKGLVRVAGRADLPGNPLLYGTTQRFLELFGLRNLRDLPSDDQLLKRPGG